MHERERFEAWLCPSNDCATNRRTLQKDPDGSYAQALPRLQWKVWQAALAQQREPLTEEEIDGIYLEVVGPKGGKLSRAFARAIERKHGIGEKE